MAKPVRTKTIPALEARTQLGQIMKDVQSGSVRVLVEKSAYPWSASSARTKSNG